MPPKAAAPAKMAGGARYSGQVSISYRSIVADASRIPGSFFALCRITKSRLTLLVQPVSAMAGSLFDH